MTTRFIAAVLLVVACCPARLAPAAQEAQAPDAGQSWIPPACSDCMHHFPQSCEYMGKAPIVALVEGTRSVATNTECEPLTHPNYASWCYSSVVYEFRSIRFIRNTAHAQSQHRFASSFKYKHNTPNATKNKQGVALEADEAYLIVAGPAAADSQPSAQWFITSACKTIREQRVPAAH